MQRRRNCKTGKRRGLDVISVTLLEFAWTGSIRTVMLSPNFQPDTSGQ